MSRHNIAQYNAFSATLFGGSPAALVDDADSLDEDQMQRLALEFNVPATAFIQSISSERVEVRFFSTRTEYPMCGHASIALMTWLHERGILKAGNVATEVTLGTPSSDARCLLSLRTDERLQVMLTLAPATFERFAVSNEQLHSMLRIGNEHLHGDLPTAFTHCDFGHLFVPARNLDTVQQTVPDFEAITNFCIDHGIDTLVLFTLETVDSDNTVHMREFCPALGTPEAAAAGTTNRALACYLVENGAVSVDAQEAKLEVRTEQGYEMARPSHIVTEVTLADGLPASVDVGGVATKFFDGKLEVDQRE